MAGEAVIARCVLCMRSLASAALGSRLGALWSLGSLVSPGRQAALLGRVIVSSLGERG